MMGNDDFPELKGEFRLEVAQAVYVPSTSAKVKRVAASTFRKRISEVQTFLNETFGGSTSIRGMGSYITDEKVLVTEDVMIVESYATKDGFAKNRKRLLRQLREWGRRWGQESMGYELEGDLYYIDT